MRFALPPTCIRCALTAVAAAPHRDLLAHFKAGAAPAMQVEDVEDSLEDLARTHPFVVGAASPAAETGAAPEP